MKINPEDSYFSVFFKNFVGGIGWVAGITVGFALFISLLGFLFNRLGGLPLIGNWFANLIEVINQALEAKKTLPR